MHYCISREYAILSLPDHQSSINCNVNKLYFCLFAVTYNFQHDGMYCLQLEVGDTVHNLCQEEHWYFGYSIRNRALKGIYPKSYVNIQESFIEKTAVGEQVFII